MNTGTIPFYENGGQVRNLNGDGSSYNETISVNSTNSTEMPLGNGKVPLKKLKNSTKKNKKSSKKSKNKKRVNREILTTLLSRKKLYKILEHKLDM